MKNKGSGFSNEQAVWRIIDVNFNRAIEAFRVVEDTLRFVLEREDLVSAVKLLRRNLGKVVFSLKPQIASIRDVLSDVGIEKIISPKKESIKEIFLRNSSKLKEALRVLEEYASLIDPAIAYDIAQIRYSFYETERNAQVALFPKQRLTSALLYVIVSSSASKGAVETAHLAISGGADMIQLREKGLSDAEVLKTARAIRKLCDVTGTLFIVNDRPDIAVCVNADGVHLGQEDLPLRDARKIVGTDKIIGVSTHSFEQAMEAQSEGADYIGVGAVFLTKTKEMPLVGGLKLVRSARKIKIPWFAIGGISAENLPDVIAAGAMRVAVVSYICSAKDPEKAAKRLKKILTGARKLRMKGN